mgnify:CR=1 FL=1
MKHRINPHKSREKSEKAKKKHGIISGWTRIIQVASIIVILAALVAVMRLNEPLVNSGSHNYEETAPLVDSSKAVLIDGIAFTDPNPRFTASIKEILSKANISLDIYEGEEVTIDLLRNIGGYGLIILRVHSAVDERHGFLYLFSAEKFDSEEYNLRYSKEERMSGAVREGRTFKNESYFALRADLLGYLGNRGLNGSIVILMGCNGTGSQQAIDKLFERGVKAIIAWDGYVDLDYTDEIIVELLKAVYRDRMDFPEAVEKVMDDRGADPIWNSRLKCLINSNN